MRTPCPHPWLRICTRKRCELVFVFNPVNRRHRIVQRRPTAAPAGDTCLKGGCRRKPLSLPSALYQLPPLNASRKLIYPGPAVQHGDRKLGTICHIDFRRLLDSAYIHILTLILSSLHSLLYRLLILIHDFRFIRSRCDINIAQ